jgi:hypothetical protein
MAGPQGAVRVGGVICCEFIDEAIVACIICYKPINNMFGFRYVKFPPTTYVIQYVGGRISHQGAGLGFMYFAPTSTLVAIPVQSMEAQFMLSQVTSDFQEVTVQGSITFKIVDPIKIATQLNYTLKPDAKGYASDEPDMLAQRISNIACVTIQKEIKARVLRAALGCVDELPTLVLPQLALNSELSALGVELMGVSVLAVKPTPETARALEAGAREQILKEADDAIYSRRNSSVEQERKVRENELNTEIAVESKRRQIEETKMDAQRALQQKQQQILDEKIKFDIEQERKRKELVDLEASNARSESDAKAYGIEAMMKAFSGVDPRVLQSLSVRGMQPEQIIASAFQELAANAEKIGELNISPDLLSRLTKPAVPSNRA